MNAGLVVLTRRASPLPQFDEILGRGAFKTVYKAFDEVEGIEVAWCVTGSPRHCNPAIYRNRSPTHAFQQNICRHSAAR